MPPAPRKPPGGGGGVEAAVPLEISPKAKEAVGGEMGRGRKVESVALWEDSRSRWTPALTGQDPAAFLSLDGLIRQALFYYRRGWLENPTRIRY